MTILGIYVADLAFMAGRQPAMGETIIGSRFVIGPGGKGSNQAVAAARAGAAVRLITRLGDDQFAAMARETWARAGVKAHAATDPDLATGAAYIFVSDVTGDNAIIVVPGAAGAIGAADVAREAAAIAGAAVFMTQLEQPLAAARRGLEIARESGVITILNPAPAAEVPDAVFALCDYVTPNETEAAALTGLPVTTIGQARAAADVLRARGAGAALITLGAQGVLVHGADVSVHLPAFCAGAVIDTAGAGDAFNGGFAAALARGADPVAAARLGCAAGALAVTRRGTAASMPDRHEIEALLGNGNRSDHAQGT